MIAPGDLLEPFTLPAADGTLVSWRPGRVLTLVMVAFWCDTWREQLARMEAARRAVTGLPVDFLRVSVDGRWVEKAATRGPVLRDPDGRWSRGLGIDAVPFTLVVDAQGVVRAAVRGIARTDALVGAVRQSLAPTTRAEPVFLTFDDFPQADDDLLLDILRARATPAALFCVAAHLAEPTRAAIARRALAEGHALQIHAWSHDPDRPQPARCAAALVALGAAPTLYRPPGSTRLYAWTDSRSGPERHVTTVTPYDETRPGEAELRRRLVPGLRPGAVVQLHAGVAETRAVLAEALPLAQRRGLRFAPLR